MTELLRDTGAAIEGVAILGLVCIGVSLLIYAIAWIGRDR